MSGSRSASRVARRPPSRLVELTQKRIRAPGHVPTPPRPQTGFASGRPSPRGLPHPVYKGAGISANPLQALGVLLRAPDINVGAAADHGRGFLVERADDAPGRADDQ